MSTSSRMFFKIAEVGLRGFDTPFETVDVEMPICSESHLLVRFFSTKTNLTRVYLPYYMYFYCANICLSYLILFNCYLHYKDESIAENSNLS